MWRIQRACPARAAASTQSAGTSRILNLLPAKVVAAFQATGGTNSVMATGSGTSPPLHTPVVVPPVQSRANGSVVVDAGQRVAVPAFSGDALRKVVETAAGLGLRVEPVGSGIAREQAPAAGTRSRWVLKWSCVSSVSELRPFACADIESNSWIGLRRSRKCR